MSRNRYGRDDRDYFGGGPRGGRGGEERYEPERGDYGHGGGAMRDRDFGYDESYGARGSRAGGERDPGRDDYGRGAGFGMGGGYEERGHGDYVEARRGRRRQDDERAAERHSAFDDRDDFFRPEYEERGRGASRSHLRCRDIMTRDVTVATRETTLQEVAMLMRDEDTGVIPVVERQEVSTDAAATAGAAAEDTRRSDNRTQGNGKLVGLITDRDVVVRALAEGKDARTTRVEEVMTTDIHTAQPNDRVIDAIRKMGDKQVRRIPIVDDQGTLRGIISMADVALETEEDRELAEALEEISSGASFWSKIFG
ncbi:MAG TPA: CBS domain-containing protein [Pyrinomonadaceae bacterium]|jgi:CBS domain-containing protein